MDQTYSQPAGSGGGVALRLFAALALPPPVARELAEHAVSLVGCLPDAEAGEAHHMHLTFAYLGDVPEELLSIVAGALDEVARDIPGPVHCVTRALGLFGSGRVLGADINIDLLTSLGSARDRLLMQMRPYAPQLDDRPWRPHISLARARHETIALHGTMVLPSTMSWVSSALELHASLPAPGGRMHRQLHAVPLGTTLASR